MNSNITKILMLIALIAYVISPVDLLPGNPLDDVILTVAYLYANRNVLNKS